jgi:pimeloyl-ACP methyl ester carboxylesterase
MRRSVATVFRTAFILFAFAFWGPPAGAQTVVQDIGGTQLLYAGGTTPRAVVFVFAGGDGAVAFTPAGQFTHLGGNFLLRTQASWLAQGFAFATLGSPSSLLGQRHTPAYAATIGRAIDFIRTKTTAPIWLIGTSMGSIAAANGAASLPGRVAGVVLTSSVAGQSRAGETVFDSNLGAIAVPASRHRYLALSPARRARTSSTSRATRASPSRANRCRRMAISVSRAMSYSASRHGSGADPSHRVGGACGGRTGEERFFLCCRLSPGILAPACKPCSACGRRRRAKWF